MLKSSSCPGLTCATSAMLWRPGISLSGKRPRTLGSRLTPTCSSQTCIAVSKKELGRLLLSRRTAPACRQCKARRHRLPHPILLHLRRQANPFPPPHPQQLPEPAKGGDVAAVAQDLNREAALAAFAAMQLKEKNKFSTRIAKTKTHIFQLSEDRSSSGIFKSSNPISARPLAKAVETKAAMDSAPTRVEVRAPPVKEAEMDMSDTAVQSSEPPRANNMTTPATIEAIVMAEATSAVSAPVMDPITITVVGPEPSYLPSSSPLFDISDLYAGFDSFFPPVLAATEDIFDLSFPEAQFGGDLPSFGILWFHSPVPDVSPPPASDSSAYAADDEAMLVDDEWAMDGVWASGIAEPYAYSEFDIVVDTPADMAAAERGRIAWEKKCRASEPVVEAIVADDDDEIPGLNLPPPAFRCSSFEWRNLDLGLPGSSYYSPPSPGSDSDSDSNGPPTPKDAYDPYDADEIALYGGFDDGLTKVSPLFEDPFSTEKVDALLEYLVGDMDLGGPGPPPSSVDRKSDVKTSATQRRYSPYSRRPAAADFF
ncbi:hypothetical protein BDZ89DRAFT_237400 [Hymenopellis radicata]|nr:hypothetical protein BDZ89DRAFT_237400 [Hymenopellis radicata]